MKKSIIAGVLFLMLGWGSAFARNEEIISERVINSFKKEFTGAQEVSWEGQKTFAKATFKLNNQVMFAYYSKEGELMAVIRNMASGQLPIGLLTELKKNYQQYWITDLFEKASNGSSNYFVTLENGDETLVLKADGLAGWQLFKVTKNN
ncbi:MAG: hypothetical protein P0Y53_04170 [Candidatus Pseudobacter hemicellulosilyticus]|uniref:Beta-lactamase-inhibitor-like PepSY-like domain-containing protein n=1 Tax=Candidatus Pseudobacter hemicellulosilyticus TaxID=3121375 RepID=A0AAJ5WV52_9BACT|nr:MAG: hypothetical protein P0Y53_04170 [Pseudobacter sp.]